VKDEFLMIVEVLNSYDLHFEFLRTLVSDLSAEQMVSQPEGVPNHPAWTVGHLAFSCQAIGGEFGLKAWLPADWEEKFGTGSTPVADESAYPDKEALLEALADGKSRLSAALQEMGDVGLAEPLPDVRYRDKFPTIGHAVIHILSGHTALHLGQLTVWRHAMQLPLVVEPLNQN
jgi:hypothetical protein